MPARKVVPMPVLKLRAGDAVPAAVAWQPALVAAPVTRPAAWWRRDRLVRAVLPTVLASVFIFGLFWLLHRLISGPGEHAGQLETLPTIDFVRLNKAFEVETRERTPPKMPDKPQAPPSEVASPDYDPQAPQAGAVDLGSMNIGKDVSLAGMALAASDGEYLPIVKVTPMYPPRAQSLGQEGWVLLKFTVTESGAVSDPVVVEAQPPGVFDEAARKAVLKFKYKPRIENGKPVAVANVEHLISFRIEKGKR